MTRPTHPAFRPSAALYYNAACPPCRVIARIVRLLSGRAVRLATLEQPEARAFFATHPDRAGLPALREGPQVTVGWWILAALPGVALRHTMQRLKDLRDRPPEHDGLNGEEGP